MGWGWLNDSEGYNWRFVFRVLIKSMLLFVLFNVVYALVQPLPVISRLTVYNTAVPGRERLPYSDNPSEAFNMSLQRLEGMFASHIISQEKSDSEFRVILIGDSSVWGVLLANGQTLSACLNRLDLHSNDGRSVRVYNLGYPVLSVLKDAVIMLEALKYDVDAVVWLTTLQAFWDQEQFRHPITENNSDLVQAFLRESYLEAVDYPIDEAGFLDRTIIGQRRELADWLRYQIYGLGWWLTGDDYAPARFVGTPVSNLPDSEGILNQPDISVGDLLGQDVLATDIFEAAVRLLEERDIPFLIVNEPIFISQGANSDLRYNEYYPRWAYDEYRQWINQQADDLGWHLVDVWDFVPAAAFTDTPFHFDAENTCALGNAISDDILTLTR